jgi:hypothetical protein
LTLEGVGYITFYVRTRYFNMLDSAVTERIRAIFLHAEKHVTIEEAAAMLGRSEAEILRHRKPEIVVDLFYRDASTYASGDRPAGSTA